MSNTKGLKILILPDAQVKPGVDLSHIAHAGKLIVDEQPDVIVNIGDWFDLPSLSSYDKGMLSAEGRRLHQDIKAGRDAMDVLFKPLRAFQSDQKARKKKVYQPRLIYTIGNHECLTPDHEVMTKTGFKPIAEVTTEDFVATMATDDSLQWAKPNSLIQKTYQDDLVVMESRSFSFSGTKKHRVIYKSCNSTTLEKEAQEMCDNFSIVTAFNSKNEEYNISDDVLMLSAWLCSDSYFPPSGNPILYQRESNAHKIEDLLNTLKVPYTKTTRERDIKEICGRRLIKKPESSVEFYLQCNPCEVYSNKYLPHFVDKLSQRQWDVFQEVLIDADGTVPTRAVNSRVFYGAKKICEDVQFHATTHGWTASLTEYRPNQWRVNLVKKTVRRQEKLVKKFVPYSGMVYCLEMDFGNFVTRRNNRIHVTGNCRIDRIPANAPELEGVVGYELLGLDEYGWEVYDFLEPAEVGGISFIHYAPNPFSGKPYGGSAMNILKNVGKSFVMGHKQMLDIAIRPVYGGQMQLGIIAGAFYSHEEHYKGPTGNNHWRGLLLLNNVKDGFGDPTFLSIETLAQRYK